MTSEKAPPCLICKHFHRKRSAWACDAFPTGIPKDMLRWKHDHRRPHPGDRGIRFEPDDLEGIESLYKLWDEIFSAPGPHVRHLEELSELIRTRNQTEQMMSVITESPAEIGPVGEFITSEIFDIRLNESRSKKGFDGVFRSGPLADKTVNIKWFSKQRYELDINPSGVPDFYLVLTGPQEKHAQKGVDLWLIREVYVFDGPGLVEKLRGMGLKPQVATYVRKEHWPAEMVFPEPRNPRLRLSEEQERALRLFS